MKNIVFSLFLALFLVSCGSDKWEYKTVSVNSESTDKFSPGEVKISNEDLNLFGQEGWELVGVYTITETVHPNFGNSEYVNGIQPNVRTGKVNFIFKRKV